MTQPTTWEEATQDVAVALPSWREGEGMTLDEVLQDIADALDLLRGNPSEMMGYSPESSFRYLAWLGAAGYVHEKWDAAEKKVPDRVGIDFVRRCDDVVCSVLVLLPKKQHDYGPDNILWGGVQGVVIRAHDKLARIKNLRQRAEWASRQDVYGGEPVIPLNEALADSYFDLIGYGIVGAMLVKGTFQLPLEADLPKAGVAEVIAVYGQRSVDPWLTDEQIDGVRAIVRDELAKREKAKSHG